MIDDCALPPLRVFPKLVDATTFNRARLALHRIANPLRTSLTGHRGLDVVLRETQWLCVDACNGDLPILAWRDFATHRRDALHVPIECRLYLYHLHAGLIMGTALESLSKALATLLKEQTATGARRARVDTPASGD